MSETIESRLAALGITLPDAPAPAANYVPHATSGNLIFIAGQIPMIDGKPGHLGRLGADMDVAQGQEAARIVALNILAQARAACDGDLERISRCVKLGGFVQCTDDFADMPQVINGASDLMVAVLGDRGRHARFAVGVNALPFGVSVEIDAVFERA